MSVESKDHSEAIKTNFKTFLSKLEIPPISGISEKERNYIVQSFVFFYGKFLPEVDDKEQFFFNIWNQQIESQDKILH